MNINTQKTIGVVAVGLLIIGMAFITMPTQKSCAPTAIENYTRQIIKFKDCKALDNCVITPTDVGKYNYYQDAFDVCVAEVISNDE